MQDVSTSWRLLGEMLVDQGLLTHLQLESALTAQEQSGRRLGEILVARGYATARAIAQTLAEQLGVELDSKPPVEPARPVLRLVGGEQPETDRVPAIDRHRARLADAQLALARRDLRIAELENRLARLERD